MKIELNENKVFFNNGSQKKEIHPFCQSRAEVLVGRALHDRERLEGGDMPADRERRNHRRDLRPRVHPPPVPAQNQHRRRAGHHHREELVDRQDVVEARRDQEHDRDDRQHEQTAEQHVATRGLWFAVCGSFGILLDRIGFRRLVARGRSTPQRPDHIVHQVGRRQVEVRVEGRHERRDHGRDEKALEPRPAEPIDHRRIRRLAVDRAGRQHRERTDRDHDPRPRPQRVVGNREPEHREHAVPLAARRQNPLRSGSMARRSRPPREEEPARDGERHRVTEGRVGQEPEVPIALRHVLSGLLEHRLEAAEVRGDRARHGHRADHRHHELDEVRPHDAIQAAENRVAKREEGEAKHDCGGRLHLEAGRAREPRPGRIGRDAEHGREDLAEADRDRRDHARSDDEPLMRSVEDPKHSGSEPVVAELDEPDVGDHAASPPERGEEEDACRVPGRHRPPPPVLADAAIADHPDHLQGRVAREGRRDDRGARDPPRQASPGEEELGAAAARATPEEEGDRERPREVCGDHQPVEGGEAGA